MDFINIVKEKATEIAIGAAKVSNSAMIQVKSNLYIADKKQEKEKTLEMLGTLVYEAYKAGTDPDTDKVAEKCVIVDKLNEEIDELKKAIHDVKNVKLCQSCGAEIKNDHNFCPKCGEKSL